jgi:hypothetical protein
VITDNRPEQVVGGFKAALAAKRFHGTIVQECWRAAFHRRRFTRRRQLQAATGAWLVTYNHPRRNHGDYMRGRTPRQIFTALSKVL